MVRKVVMNLDLSKASGPDCIPVVVLKNYEHELSYILSELFNKCLKESCFPDCWRVSSVVPVFKNVGERSTAKKYHSLVVSDRTARAFNRSGVTQAVALDIKAFGRVWHAGLLHKLNPLSTNFTKWSNTNNS